MAKVVVLTGCASGMGQALAAAFGKAGWDVLATGLSDESLAAAAAEAGWASTVHRQVLDVRKAADWDRAMETVRTRWGRLDVLANVAGYLLPGRIDRITPEDIDRHIDVNTKGVMLGTRAAANQFLAQGGGGHIINIASLAGMTPVPGLSLYSASKFAVRGFSLSVAQELKPHGIAVTVVCPDAVRTPMLDLQVDYEESALVFSGGRALTVDDICAEVLGPVLRKRPLEVTLPLDRGVLARLGGLMPGVVATVEPMLRKHGVRKQAKEKAAREAANGSAGSSGRKS